MKLTRAGSENVHEIDQPFALLGSHCNCDVVVSDLAAKCLLILATNIGIRGLVLSPHGKKAGQLFRIDSDRPFKLGGYDVTVDVKPTAPGNQNPIESSEASISAVTWKAGKSRRFLQLPNQKPILFGRKAPSELNVDDEKLSSVHGCLIRFDRQMFVIDLLSTNGTTVSGTPVRCAAVEQGKSFKAGSHHFHFLELWNEPLDAQPSRGHGNLLTQNSHAQFLCAKLDRQLQILQQNNAEREAIVSQLQQERDVLTTAYLTLQEQQSELLLDMRGELEEQKAHAAANLKRSDELVQELEELRETNAALLQTKRELDEKLADAIAGYDELKSSLIREDDATAERARLLAEAEADLRRREEELERLHQDLSTERSVLQALTVDVVEGESAPQPSLVEDETCISSLDFHDMLTRALDALPAVDQQERDAAG